MDAFKGRTSNCTEYRETNYGPLNIIYLPENDYFYKLNFVSLKYLQLLSYANNPSRAISDL